MKFEDRVERTIRWNTLFSEEEAGALNLLARRKRTTASAVVRELIMREAGIDGAKKKGARK